MAERSDRELIHSIQAGNEEAFRVLFDRHVGALRGRLQRWLSSRIRRKVSVSDVLQETRLVAYQRLSDFIEKGDEGSFRSWLFRILELKLSEVVRRYAGTAKRAVDREVTRGQRPDSAQFVGRQPSPSEFAVASETKERVRTALETLPEDYREVLRLVREDGLTLRQAAHRMGRTREATKKLYGRAILRLTKAFESPGGGGHA